MNVYEFELNSVKFSYPQTNMHFDLKVVPDSLTIITGPSGSGKSTLLNLIAGFEAPTSGSIIISGEDMVPLNPSKRPIAMLFQDHNLFNHITVEDNVGLGIRPNLNLSEIKRERVKSALVRVGLGDKAKRLPGDLSGGEQQRAAFARVLVQDRNVLLLDEPFASLGPSLRVEMIKLLAELRHEKQLTILAVTHHPLEWAKIADRFIFVDAGAIAAHGPMKELATTHSNAAIKQYLG